MAEKKAAGKGKKKPPPFTKGGATAKAGENKTPGKKLPPWLKGKDDK